MFRKSKDGVTLQLDAAEAELLVGLFEQMVELLEPPDVPMDTDPLARMVGLDGPTEPPRDPAVARLLPPGYTDDDEAAAEFRRYTEPDLRSAKVMNARITLALLDEWTGATLLNEDQAKTMMLALNDMRLVLGTRIGVGETDRDDDGDEFDDDDADDELIGAASLYDWLTYLQGSLIDAISRP